MRTRTQCVLQGLHLLGPCRCIGLPSPKQIQGSCSALGLCCSAIHQLKPCSRGLLPQWWALSSWECETKAVSTALWWCILKEYLSSRPSPATFRDQAPCKTYALNFCLFLHTRFGDGTAIEPSLFKSSQASKKLLTSHCGQHTPGHSEPLQLLTEPKAQVTGGWTSLKFEETQFRIKDFLLLL